MSTTGTDLVTGGFSYTGRFITTELLSRGRRVRTMTGHPDREHPFGGQVEAVPYSFHDPEALTKSLAGVHTVYNTYWVRFDKWGLSFRDAIHNTQVFLEACREAGVKRFVHISVSNPSIDSALPYYRGKAETEALVRASGLPWRIIRPTLILGKRDILLNNIAWLLRRFPLFVIPGDGRYRVQPVTGEDVARIAVQAATGNKNVTLDAAGPETLHFNEVVRAIAAAIGAKRPTLHAPAGLTLALGRVAGLLVRDVVLTRDEYEGLQQELLVSHHDPLGTTGFTDWLNENGGDLGRRYASEKARHFRGVNRRPHTGG